MTIAPSRGSIRFRRSKVVSVAKTLEKILGIPRPPKKLAKPLDMLIATILSQNTNDKNSHRAYLNLRKKYPHWNDLLHTSVRRIAKDIRLAGMANQKSVHIKKILKIVRERYGKVDLSALKKKSNEEIIAELTAFNGVGVKTASCVLLFSLGRDAFPVDTHVHRICNRLAFIPKTASPEKTFEAMKHLVPKGKGYSFHTNLIRFGRKICRAHRPLCGICPVYNECIFEQKNKFRVQTPRTKLATDHDFMLLDNVA